MSPGPSVGPERDHPRPASKKTTQLGEKIDRRVPAPIGFGFGLPTRAEVHVEREAPPVLRLEQGDAVAAVPGEGGRAHWIVRRTAEDRIRLGPGTTIHGHERIPWEGPLSTQSVLVLRRKWFAVDGADRALRGDEGPSPGPTGCSAAGPRSPPGSRWRASRAGATTGRRSGLGLVIVGHGQRAGDAERGACLQVPAVAGVVGIVAPVHHQVARHGADPALSHQWLWPPGVRVAPESPGAHGGEKTLVLVPILSGEADSRGGVVVAGVGAKTSRL